MTRLMKGRTPLLLLASAVLVATVSGFWTQETKDVYATVGHSITRTVGGVPSEKLLVEYCVYLNSINGVQSVTYGNYSPSKHTATVTVFYDPERTSIRNIQTFMQFTKAMWQEALST